jgi:hypothetical protein
MDREKLRPLILQDNGIRHPFRQTLPMTIVQMAREEHESEAAAITKADGIGDDVSLFLLSFLAFFTAFYMFIF